MSLKSHPTFHLLLFAIACDLEHSTDEDACGLQPGALVITEVMADPWGPEADGTEWIELYNAATEPIPLKGTVVERARADGRGISGFRVTDDVTVEPGDYVVLGEVTPELRPNYIELAYGDALADLVNTGGRVSIGCPGRLVDAVAYAGVGDGVAFGFDGTGPPDPQVNDDPARWCAQRTAFGDGVGTPGVRNDRCPGPPPEHCDTADGPRPVRPPEPGDLVIAELFVDPSGADEGREWLEVFVHRDVDLDGLTLGLDDESVQILAAECVPAEAGRHLVIAGSSDPATNGGLPNVDVAVPLELPNEGPRRVWLGYGDVLLDEVVYASAATGAAWSLDPGFVEAAANDAPGVFCPAETAWLGGDLGTPGGPNPVCASAVPEGQCRDADGIRPIRGAAPGDVAIVEIMADPATVSDPEGEWLELGATRPVDLNGLTLARADGGGATTFQASTCLPLEPGAPVVVARRSEPERNGGLPPAMATFTFSLPSEGALELRRGETALDRAEWTGAVAGTALAMDSEGSWCAATAAYGAGDLGSPGVANAACEAPSGARCRDGGELRPVRAPAVGELVITELMADPFAVADATGEWLEILATAPVDLAGIRLVVGEREVVVAGPDDECLAVQPGERIVVARSSDGAINGGLPSVGIAIDLSLPNSGGVVALRSGSDLVDGFVYGPASAGQAVQVGPGFETESSNDEAQCLASTPYGLGDLGSPGTENQPCR